MPEGSFVKILRHCVPQNDRSEGLVQDDRKSGLTMTGRGGENGEEKFQAKKSEN